MRTELFAEGTSGAQHPDVGVDIYDPAPIERRVRFEVTFNTNDEHEIRESFMPTLLDKCLGLLCDGHTYVWLVRSLECRRMSFDFLGDQITSEKGVREEIRSMLQSATCVEKVELHPIVCDLCTEGLPHYESVLGSPRGILWSPEPDVNVVESISGDGRGTLYPVGSTWLGENWSAESAGLSYRRLERMPHCRFIDPDSVTEEINEITAPVPPEPEVTDGTALPPGMTSAVVVSPETVPGEDDQLVKTSHRFTYTGEFHRLIEHLAEHGILTEEDAMTLAGGARAYRRFVLALDRISGGLPFRVEVVSSNGRKRYLRR